MPPKTKDVMARLSRDGWVADYGKGDHVNFRKPSSKFVITIDTGAKELPKGTYSSIARMAGWK